MLNILGLEKWLVKNNEKKVGPLPHLQACLFKGYKKESNHHMKGL